MSMTIKSRRLFFLVGIVAGAMLYQSSSPVLGHDQRPYDPATAVWYLRNSNVAGTWKGESICVGKRSGCTNEVLVYRFEGVAGRVGVMMLFADKVVEGARVPMYQQEVHFKERSWQLTGATISGTLYGYWQYTVTATGEGSGTFHMLPKKAVARRLQMKRVDAREVPAAPRIEQYEVLDLRARSVK